MPLNRFVQKIIHLCNHCSRSRTSSLGRVALSVNGADALRWPAVCGLLWSPGPYRGTGAAGGPGWDILGSGRCFPSSRRGGLVLGAGPAYVCFLIEEFAAASRGLGLDEATTSELLLETFYGSLSLLEASGRAPSALLTEISSPGSATERVIAALEQAAVSGTRSTLCGRPSAGQRS